MTTSYIYKKGVAKTLTLLMAMSSVVMMPSCTKDLDQEPHTEESASKVYSTVEGCNGALAKIYASFVTTGQAKNGNSDFSTNTGHDLMRAYINMQEAPTEEMAATWLSGDNMEKLTFMTWDENDPWISDMYYRTYYTIALANDFIKNVKDNTDATVVQYKNEARFLRAMAYYMALDLYGKVPFVDENSTASTLPEAMSSSALFAYIEKELTEVADVLPAKGKVEYGRASKGAAYALLAKLYLNAGVYLNDERNAVLPDAQVKDYYTKCINACNKVEAEGYSIEADYSRLFNADNDKRTNEIIFPFVVDATNTISWGATTLLVCGAIGSSNNQVAANYGANTGWGNFRVRGELSSIFESGDARAMFYTADSQQYFNGKNIDDQAYGWFGTKYTNLTDEGKQSSNTADNGVNTDYPMLRYADVLLMKAEAMVRSGQTSGMATVLEPIFTRSTIAKSDAQILADKQLGKIEHYAAFFLKERARELWQECTRRTDLVRFGVFAGSDYTWEWKGGKAAGAAPSLKNANVYPIPYAELSANPNLSNDWIK